jgi:alpha-ribazole phosphatase
MALVTRWWWVRHAPVTVNDGCCYGQTDLPCNTGNSAAFAHLARRLPQDAVWVASPLQRTHMTAAALVAAGAHGPAAIPGPDIHIEPDFIEQHFGDWQGVKYTELAARRSDDWHRFWLSAPHETPPGGESFAVLSERVGRAVLRLEERYRGRDIVAVTHGGTIRGALAQALDIAPETVLAFSIDTLSLTRIEYFPEPGAAPRWRVAAVNQTPD